LILMQALLTTEVLSAFLTLTFLEIVLGIDNILFVSIIAGKLKESLQKKAIRIGMIMAMVLRLVLLLGISVLIDMQGTWISVNNSFFQSDISGQAIILFFGGIFLLYKSTKEIYEKVEHSGHKIGDEKGSTTMTKAIIQITILNFVFSIDSILTAVGMTNGLPNAIIIMAISIVVSVLIMMIFAHPVGEFVNKHPSLQVLGLSFLMLIGFMLLAEAAHLSHTRVLGNEIGAIPKGYLYFAITFSLLVEFLNMKTRKPKKV